MEFYGEPRGDSMGFNVKYYMEFSCHVGKNMKTPRKLYGIPPSFHVFCPRSTKLLWSISHEIPYSLHGKFLRFSYGILRIMGSISVS